MHRDPYDIAIDQILEGAGGDIRLALRTLLIQRLELEFRLRLLEEASGKAGASPSDKATN